MLTWRRSKNVKASTLRKRAIAERALGAASVFVCLAGAGTVEARSAEWRYGEHPLWGLSAFVTVGGESVGLRCLPARDISDSVAALVVTKGLGKPFEGSAIEGLVSYKFLGAKDWGSGLFASKGAYYENTGSTCDTHVESMQNARELLFVDSAADKRQIDEIPDSQLKIISRIPLTGAKSAIAKLMRSCPMMRKDIDNQCGI